MYTHSTLFTYRYHLPFQDHYYFPRQSLGLIVFSELGMFAKLTRDTLVKTYRFTRYFVYTCVRAYMFIFILSCYSLIIRFVYDKIPSLHRFTPATTQ